MYYLFRFHGYKVSEIKSMKHGERQLLYAMMRYEIDQRIKENTPTKEAQ